MFNKFRSREYLSRHLPLKILIGIWPKIFIDIRPKMPLSWINWIGGGLELNQTCIAVSKRIGSFDSIATRRTDYWHTVTRTVTQTIGLKTWAARSGISLTIWRGEVAVYIIGQQLRRGNIITRGVELIPISTADVVLIVIVHTSQTLDPHLK